MRILVDDVSLYFDVDGSALVPAGDAMRERPALVLLHGGPGADHSLFKPECGRLTDLAQVVYLDQRGSGRSDPGRPADWTWTRWADDVAAFCAALALDRVVLVGTSSGGLVAMTAAARHPELVAGLILDSTLGVPAGLEETLEVFAARGGPVAREAARAYLTGDTGVAATRAWQEHALPLYGGADASVRRARARMSAAVQEHFRRGGCGPADATALLPRITCPTLILAGEHDPVAPAAASHRLAASLTGAVVTVETLAGVGHGVFRQDPERAFALVRRFLGQVCPESVGPGD